MTSCSSPIQVISEARDHGEAEGLVGVHRVQYLARLLQGQRLADDPGGPQDPGLDQGEQPRVVHVRVSDASGDLDLALDDLVKRYRYVAPLGLAGQADLDQPSA